ncbi:MerR family DNA-binding transcriptional regulator [Paucibacter sp. APW11]|uniref:MerR family DNA-binding transcriptional regulator n=1 Tax=Roseateles aquae TaxID=3077235 RepID=A0ABU3PAS6_9BURK|nr:MerR family transcriptional regulator [Paucibacter sp. APW11]MDT8999613.1 MerR family DNA-binding transcriptional regulator [Paucibacter sp. APW11]
MQIGQLAELSGLSRDTLRFYEKRGLLQPRRSANGYRDYPAEALPWLAYLRTAQALGFTLAEIEADLPLLGQGADAAPQLREALRRKLGDIDARIAALSELRESLRLRLEDMPDDCPLRPQAPAKTPRKRSA